MNEIVNSILVAGDKFINEIHLGQPGFTYRAYGKNKLKKKKNRRFTIYLFGVL